jgi:hypothetical protein
MGTAFALANLAQALLKEGDPDNATLYLAEGLFLFQQMGHRRGLIQCVATYGALHLLEGDLPRAITLFSVAQALHLNEVSLDKSDLVELEEQITQARALASESVWSAAWGEGQNMTLEQAIDSALELP